LKNYLKPCPKAKPIKTLTVCVGGGGGDSGEKLQRVLNAIYNNHNLSLLKNLSKFKSASRIRSSNIHI
jgi:hypothetical protein